ncbi:MAG: hypothetical protein U0R69_07505 [Gaiellales bacterium]
MGKPARVEKRKWDGALSAVAGATVLDAIGEAVVWFVPEGTRRERPERGVTELVARDELWTAVPGGWWVLCAEARAGESISGYELHAAAPFERPAAGVVSWVDLDLDLSLHGDELELMDEAVFHHHAETMGYPPDVVRGAWEGISELAPRYTTGQWPFDGWLQERLQAARRRTAGGSAPDAR